MVRTAVLITVYNRRDVTLQGLRSLEVAINNLKGNYLFDIYLTDDGCTDGTLEAVQEEFPDITIINGNGSLFWGGGMRSAWIKALESSIVYDYFLWYNDDSLLYNDSLISLFKPANKNSIIVGAFCDKNSNPSYGGRENGSVVVPNGQTQEITLMNGNLVLIPYSVYQVLGMIDKHFVHGEGDFDYGLRARHSGFHIILTSKYVGIAERHDEYIPKYCLSTYSFMDRWKFLHSPIYSPKNHFVFNYRYKGIMRAIFSLLVCYMGVMFPSVYVKMKTYNFNSL